MNFHDLRKPDFGNGPQEYVVNRLVFKTLKAGFDPRGDAFELMQAMKGDLENLRSERGFTYTKSQISWMLHRMVRHVLDKGDAASYVVLDRDGNIYANVRHEFHGYDHSPWPSHILPDEDCLLKCVDADSDEADLVVYELPEADWDDNDIELIKLRGECIYGIKRDGPIPPPQTEEERWGAYAESIRWQKG
jgi:hypothetical protein